MIRTRRTNHSSTRKYRSNGGHIWAALVLITVLSTSLVGVASQSLVLDEGGSTILHFAKMHRVAVVDPTVADVVVSSVSELLVYGKQAGKTTIYVWDKQGRHEFGISVTAAQQAQQLAAELRKVLGPQFRYEVLNGNTLLVDGTVGSTDETQRAARVIEGLATQVQVINLIGVEDAQLNPAQRWAKSLRKLLGDQFDYLAWDENTVLIVGQADSYAEAKRVHEVASTVTGPVRISNLVTVGPHSAPPPAEEIAIAIGPGYQVWALRGTTVVVEGEAPNILAKARVDNILAAFKSTEIINLVTAGTEPKVPLGAQRDLLQAALGEGLQVRVVEGKALTVEGLVASEAAGENVKKLIDLFKPTKVVDLTSVANPAKQQILVRAKIIEINRSELDRLGIKWGQIRAGAFLDQPFLVQAEGPISSTVYPIGAQIDALVKEDLARVLSTPQLLVNDAETAHMVVGGEVPIPVPQATGGGGLATITIEYKEYGVKLDITPTIIPGTQRIELKVTPEVSSIDLATPVAYGGVNIPAFRTRSVTTTVTVDSGETLIIAGLVQHEQSEVITKIPILGDLPIIGQLFRHREFQEGKTELIILITPEIMAGGPAEVYGATEPEVVNP